MMENKMSIIIPHHQDESSLKRLIKSLSDQQVSFQFETIVVSNPPSLVADEFLKGFARTQHLQSNVIGVNHARNLGIARSNGEILLFLDSDCELSDSSFLERHCQLHRKYPQAVCIGGVYAYEGKKIRDLTYNYIQTKWLLQGQDRESSLYLIGGNFSCKKNELGKYQFDNKISYGGSETEFFKRMRLEKNALYILVQDLVVTHNTNLGLTEFIKKGYRQGAGAAYIDKKLKTKQEVPLLNNEVSRFEKSHYVRRMDFWMSLYDKAYNSGYSKGGSCNYFAAISIFIFRIFNFYRVRASDFFSSLENILRNLPKS